MIVLVKKEEEEEYRGIKMVITSPILLLGRYTLCASYTRTRSPDYVADIDYVHGGDVRLSSNKYMH